MAAPRKRMGRPPKRHPEGSSVLFSLQMPGALKTQLQEHADAGNRTLSQEILRRLARSLDPDALWHDAFAEVTSRAYARSRSRRRRQEVLAMGYALKAAAAELGRQIDKFEQKDKEE